MDTTLSIGNGHQLQRIYVLHLIFLYISFSCNCIVQISDQGLLYTLSGRHVCLEILMGGIDRPTRWKDKCLEYGASKFLMTIRGFQSFLIIQGLSSHSSTIMMEDGLIGCQLGSNSQHLLLLRLWMVFTGTHKTQEGILYETI